LVVLLFAAGFSLVVHATANTEAVTAVGLTLQAHVIKGLGLITVILSVVAFLAVYGNSLPPNRSERRKQGIVATEDVSNRESPLRRHLPTARTMSRRSVVPSRPVDRTILTNEKASSLH
jgi:hypothetical protein